MMPYVRCPFRRSIQLGVGSRRYLLESNEFLALGDLVDLSKGAFSGLSRRVGRLSNNAAELLAIKEALLKAKDMQLRRIIVESDSYFAVQSVNGVFNANWKFWPIFTECRHLLSFFYQVSIQFCFREANMAADFLAKHSRSWLRLSLHKFWTTLHSSASYAVTLVSLVVLDKLVRTHPPLFFLSRRMRLKGANLVNRSFKVSM